MKGYKNHLLRSNLPLLFFLLQLSLPIGLDQV
jgi:hypothetical protein